MGICVSVSLSSNNGHVGGGDLLANVISLSGDLVQLPVPVTVSEALQQQQHSENEPVPCFLCSSDRLYFDEFISCLKVDYELEAGQIYFVLPLTKLNGKLTAEDMASLAVKASRALEKTEAAESAASSCSPRRKNRKTRISPIILELQQQEKDYSENEHILQKRIGGNSSFNSQKHPGLRVSRFGSVKKMQRLSSKRAKLATRSFRLKLSTIYEGSASD